MNHNGKHNGRKRQGAPSPTSRRGSHDHSKHKPLDTHHDRTERRQGDADGGGAHSKVKKEKESRHMKNVKHLNKNPGLQLQSLVQAWKRTTSPDSDTDSNCEQFSFTIDDSAKNVKHLNKNPGLQLQSLVQAWKRTTSPGSVTPSNGEQSSFATEDSAKYVKHLNKNPGLQLQSLVHAWKQTTSPGSVTPSNGEQSSFAPEHIAVDGTELGSTNTSIIDAALRDIDGTPYDVDPFACTMTAGVFRRTAPLHLDDASVSSAEEGGEDTVAEETKHSSRTRRHTTGAVEDDRPRALLPRVRRRMWSTLSPDMDELQHSLFNEESSSPASAQDVYINMEGARGGSSDNESGDAQRDGHMQKNANDSPNNTSHQTRLIMRSNEDTDSPTDINSPRPGNYGA
ncbi:hypothetical protein STCU_09953 [Strigomonas culicis]|uniref:Uncharacterized protein n=1 Tax=Strigomonas culicis TaxID=28005 RepID=S9TJY1_9TRYP|nr:hypothetical protein STCU_09953 [Strigomonas culicis]|eukprot:EPY18467.1 hypothetical protein STCU_09953 [Strigomonas culicis]